MAVKAGVRRLTYVQSVLERWKVEGKDLGGIRTKKAAQMDSDKFIKGKYGHMVQR